MRVWFDLPFFLKTVVKLQSRSPHSQPVRPFLLVLSVNCNPSREWSEQRGVLLSTNISCIPNILNYLNSLIRMWRKKEIEKWDPDFYSFLFLAKSTNFSWIHTNVHKGSLFNYYYYDIIFLNSKEIKRNILS